MRKLSGIQGLLALGLLGLPLLAGCATKPVDLKERMAQAITPPVMVADWIIQGRNDFMLVDLRPRASFDKGHLPDAISVDAKKLTTREVLRSLPDYKKLVFYQEQGQPDQELLRPVFVKGLHVMILENGYAGWQEQVLAKEAAASPDIKQSALSKFFRGESALGTPEPLEEIKAESLILPPTLPILPAAEASQEEGC